MVGLSKAQKAIARHFELGHCIVWNHKTGDFSLNISGVLSKIDQRPVEAMLLSGYLQKDSSGRCSLVALDSDTPVQAKASFQIDQAVMWSEIKRKVVVRTLKASVIRASSKQVRIKTASGEYHNVRPTSLQAIAPAREGIQK